MSGDKSLWLSLYSSDLLQVGSRAIIDMNYCDRTGSLCIRQHLAAVSKVC